MSYYRGDYYRGDYYRGDPGLFSFLKKVGKGILGAAGGFLTGGPVGAIRGAAGAVGEQDILEAGPRGLTDKELAALHNRDARLLAAGGRSDVAIRSRLTEPVTSPGMAMIPMGGPLGMAVLRGYRLNRSTYVTRGGGTSRWPMALVVHPKHTEQVRVRRMNVANPRALRRALRRASGFVKLARRAHVRLGSFIGGKKKKKK